MRDDHDTPTSNVPPGEYEGTPQPADATASPVSSGADISSWSMPPPPTEAASDGRGASGEPPTLPPGGNLGDGNRDDEDEPEGRVRVGPYVLLDRLGEGGFGIVYLAERRQPFVQRVALKILKPGVDSAAVIARFEQERQALALMDHPNIAKVLDGGLTEPDSRLGALRPYFVMELVQGVSITRYCERNKLGLRERLDLFLTVCDAVQHAHMKGLIHRDLKPGNVLVADVVGPDGGRSPVVKVIDFGIARALGGALTDKTIFTESGQIIGTPEYMPPEQAAIGESGPLDIDTRADVYSLGVILYEMLTGSLPFEPDELRRGGILEIVRIIREVEPPKPSTRVSDVVRAAKAASGIQAAGAATAKAKLPTTEVAPPSTSSVRTTLRIQGVEPASLARQLKGDLDWIVMKAIEKSRQRRYESPSSLASDIKRYIRDEPVEAGPPSVSYRVSKFVRRNRVMVTAATVCAAAMLVGLAAASYGLIEARREQRRAQTQAETASGALGVFRGALEVVDPRDPKPTMTVRELFEAIADRVDSEQSNGRAEAYVRSLIGQGLLASGNVERARENLATARDRLMEDSSIADIDRLVMTISLAWAEWARDQPDRAKPLLDEVFTAIDPDATDDRNALRVLTRARSLRSAILGRTNPAEAVVEAERAVNLARRTDGEHSAAYAQELQRLALSLVASRKELDRALSLAREAYAIMGPIFGEASGLCVQSLLVIAHCHEALNQPLENMEALRAAVELHERSKLSPSQSVGDVYGTLAKMLRASGKPGEARDMSQRALEIYRDVNPGSSGEAEIRMTIGILDLESGRLDEAAAQFDAANVTLRRIGPGSAVLLSGSLTAAARVATEQGRFQDAVLAADEAMTIRRGISGIEPRLLASTQSVLGVALAGLGKDAEAQAALLDAASLVADDPRVLDFYKAEIIARLVNFCRVRKLDALHETWNARLNSLVPRPKSSERR